MRLAFQVGMVLIMLVVVEVQEVTWALGEQVGLGLIPPRSVLLEAVEVVVEEVDAMPVPVEVEEVLDCWAMARAVLEVQSVAQELLALLPRLHTGGAHP